MPYSLPLDSEGFLRRECPTCEREFKCRIFQDGDSPYQMVEGGYFCPYCAIQAQPTAWFTQAQVELQRGLMESEVLGPQVDKLIENFRDIGRNSGGLLRVEGGNYRRPARPDPLTETEDMRRVDFVCHPEEPLKVLDDWDDDIHCLICGESAAR